MTKHRLNRGARCDAYFDDGGEGTPAWQIECKKGRTKVTAYAGESYKAEDRAARVRSDAGNGQHRSRVECLTSRRSGTSRAVAVLELSETASRG
jgi:hypothetical protein